jgi:hypothetical protein
MELIKRLLIIKVTGPSSLEDWILLFLYYENELNIPLKIEELLTATRMEPQQYLQEPHPVQEYAPYAVFPPISLKETDNFANPPMPKFGGAYVTNRNDDGPSYQMAANPNPRSQAVKALKNRQYNFPYGNSGPQQATIHYSSLLPSDRLNRPR